MAYRAESDDITTDERLSNFRDAPDVVHAQPDGVRQRLAHEAGPNGQGTQGAAVASQSSAQKLEAVGRVACADQGTYALSAEPGWRGPEVEREQELREGSD